MRSDAEIRRELRDFRIRSLEQKRARRHQRERELGEWIAASPSMFAGELFGVIYADPPWRFVNWSAAGMDRSAENHYPVMTIEAIEAMQIPAAADAVLFLWATTPMLDRGLKVMQAWRFAYVSAIIWDKQIAGTGYWTRDRSELLLIGKRGEIPAPAPGLQPDSLFSERRGAHSRKPDQVYALIETMFPHLPKLEVFARAARDGWSRFGFEAPT